MEKILVTGATGFVGSHLLEYLSTKPDTKIFATNRYRSKENEISDLELGNKKIYLHENVDYTDSASVNQLLRKIRPHKIFHLAAQSYVPESFTSPWATLSNNIHSTLNLLETIRKLKLKTKIQIAGSSEEYGLVFPNETPMVETNQLRPMSPYGVSKVTCDLLAVNYHHAYGIKTIITRAFNHSGPRRNENFCISNFSKQIAMIEAGKQAPVIRVGNLEAQRDFTDVRDIVRAYYLASEKCELGEPYNICSGTTQTIQSILDRLLEMSFDPNIRVSKDPNRMRPSEVPFLMGDYTKFRKATGWKPKISFTQTLEDTLNYWRNKTGVKIDEEC